MPSLDDLLGRIPIGDIATRLGVDDATATAAVEDALPAIVSALEVNTEDPAGAAALEKAVSDHSPALADAPVNLDEVNPADGEKIVGHVFGGHKDQVVATLSGSTGQAPAPAGPVVGELLPILAPIVLSYLAEQLPERAESSGTVHPVGATDSSTIPGATTSASGTTVSGSTARGTADASGIREVLGTMLGGSGKTSGGIGDVLGCFLGGGRT
ncbi:DUF937 domain-containing protein [Mycetocola zhujimingii]|uniref:DUF937 domain-containing protein n=1 Tax=Mycetocola zhujimingii TaxID=2079792 RepID=A0A2U1TA50_9MICO|nr:DUF937 domain-containing protein [Mycetocola zhujimingii]PWC04572.1 hypothetical protein DF223_14025 [Mycetocola zhujimingii]